MLTSWHVVQLLGGFLDITIYYILLLLSFIQFLARLGVLVFLILGVSPRSFAYQVIHIPPRVLYVVLDSCTTGALGAASTVFLAPRRLQEIVVVRNSQLALMQSLILQLVQNLGIVYATARYLDSL